MSNIKTTRKHEGNPDSKAENCLIYTLNPLNWEVGLKNVIGPGGLSKRLPSRRQMYPHRPGLETQRHLNKCLVSYITTSEVMSTVDHVAREIELLNQRGGRMLTAVDLLKAGTLDIPLTAYLMHRIRHGASIVTCAGPGGTGKTTLLGTLLCFLPPDAKIVVVEAARPSSWYGQKASKSGKTWFLCHELGTGPYFSYLWGSGARAFLQVSTTIARGFCATTVHADSMKQLKQILLGPQIGITEEALHKLNLILFMKAEVSLLAPTVRRRVTEVWATTDDCLRPHTLVCRWNKAADAFHWQPETPAGTGTQPKKETSNAISHSLKLLKPYEEFLTYLAHKHIVQVSDVRQAVLDFYQSFQEG